MSSTVQNFLRRKGRFAPKHLESRREARTCAYT
jgi:hypothetical protein